MAYTSSNGGGSSHSCRSYCNISGYYREGFSCGSLFCCGSANVRYCCNNSASLDNYSDKCRCPMSSCSYLSWDILLPCIAAGLFFFLMLAICCCHGCRGCIRFRQFIQSQCLHSNPATSTSNGSGRLPATAEEGQSTGDSFTFSHLPPYEFGPPKYESLELAGSPPKYEDIMTQGQSEGHLNTAFIGDSVTPDYSVTPDCSVTPDYRVTHEYGPTPEYSVTPDCSVTADDHSSGTIVPGRNGRVQGENDSRTPEESPTVVNSQVTGLPNSDTSYRLPTNQLPESSPGQSPPSPELTPSAGAAASTCQVASEEASAPDQVGETYVDENQEIPQVVERTPSEGRTQELPTV